MVTYDSADHKDSNNLRKVKNQIWKRYERQGRRRRRNWEKYEQQRDEEKIQKEGRQERIQRKSTKAQKMCFYQLHLNVELELRHRAEQNVAHLKVKAVSVRKWERGDKPWKRVMEAWNTGRVVRGKLNHTAVS